MENENYKIVKMHICRFERTEKGLALNLNNYPERLCVLDKNRKVAVDVKTAFEYPYVKIINMTYIANEDVNINDQKRYACIEYDSFLGIDVKKEDLLLCKEILNLLKQGVTFPDGNKELTNQEYMEMLKEEKNNIKIMKKRK